MHARPFLMKSGSTIKPPAWRHTPLLGMLSSPGWSQSIPRTEIYSKITVGHALETLELVLTLVSRCHRGRNFLITLASLRLCDYDKRGKPKHHRTTHEFDGPAGYYHSRSKTI
jgi:hypothetical protein